MIRNLQLSYSWEEEKNICAKKNLSRRFSVFFLVSWMPDVDQVYLFGGMARFLARDQVECFG